MTTEATQGAEKMLFDALDALVRGQTAPWAEMFHDDGVMEFPYAPPGYPRKLEGKPAIAAYMRGYPEIISLRSVTPLSIYHCEGTLIAEFVGKGIAVPTGDAFEMSYVAILTMENGKIRRYRDYWDALTAMRAMGGLEALQAPAAQEIR
jgi:ketosteroid isomerase-like protein